MSPKRASLSSLVSAAGPAPEPAAPAPAEAAPAGASRELDRALPRLVEDDDAAEDAATRVRSRQGGGAKPASPKARPPYQRLTRKETRIREQQYDDLTDLARRLNRARTAPGERITENTLIRVAIDLLLARRGELAGETETDLRKSVSS